MSVAPTLIQGRDYWIELWGGRGPSDSPIGFSMEEPPLSDLAVTVLEAIDQGPVARSEITWEWNFKSGEVWDFDYQVSLCPSGMPSGLQDWGCTPREDARYRRFDQSRSGSISTRWRSEGCAGDFIAVVTVSNRLNDPDLSNNVATKHIHLAGSDAGIGAGYCAIAWL